MEYTKDKTQLLMTIIHVGRGEGVNSISVKITSLDLSIYKIINICTNNAI